MRIVSVSVGTAKRREFGDKQVRTSIIKEPVSGPVFLAVDGLNGDGMANPIWGGHRRPALYAYPREHYLYWEKELGRENLPFGKFGENITTEGLLEENVHAGDVYQIGSAQVIAIGFRIPCRNLALTMDEPKMVVRFRQSGKPGIFFSVEQEGDIAAGDEIRLVERMDQDFTIAEMVGLYYDEERDMDRVKQLLAKPFLPGTVKKDFTPFTE